VLRKDGALAVDHRVGRRALLAEVHDGVGLERRERLRQKLPVADVADLQVEVPPGHVGPRAHALVERRDGRERVEPQGQVKLAAAQIVDDADLVPARREVEGGGPAAVAVAADDHDARAAAAAAGGAEAVAELGGGRAAAVAPVAVAGGLRARGGRGAAARLGGGRGAARRGGDDDLRVVVGGVFFELGIVGVGEGTTSFENTKGDGASGGVTATGRGGNAAAAAADAQRSRAHARSFSRSPCGRRSWLLLFLSAIERGGVVVMGQGVARAG